VGDWAEVVLVAVVASACVGLLGWALLSRARSLRTALVVASTTGVVAVVAGILATGQLMFLSRHDLAVALVVCLVAGCVAVASGLLLGERIRAVEDRNRELAEQRAGAEEAERTRRELVTWVSHDLRTPLAGLRAMTDALEDGMVDEPEHYYARMSQQVDRMSRMVDDLFELSRLQSGTLQLALEQVAVQDVVGDVVAATEPLAQAHHVRLSAAAEPLGVRADGRELARALSNLVVNAVRHTPDDGAVVVRAERAADGGVVMSVTDGCGGIPDDDLARIFDVGWRGTRSRTPGRDGGAGLGLAIAQGIAHAHHGEVAVRNVDGGCRFELRIPAPAIEPRSPAAQPSG